jgi:hypothetical protein
MQRHVDFRRSILVAAFAVLGSIEPITAQNFAYIGNGTTYNTSTGYPAPYGHYYWFSRHQLFVTAAELTAAGVPAGVDIKGVGFNVFSKNTQTTIYQWATAIYTTTSNNPLATAMVITGQVTNSGAPVSPFSASLGWNDHGMTPFTWNGTDNLIIETCHAHVSQFTQNASTYWTTNLTGPEIKSRWFYQDLVTQCQNSGFVGTSTTTRPNMRIEWAVPCSATPGPNTVLTPTFLVCPNSTVALGLTSSYTVGGLTYQWYSSTTSPVGPFSTVSAGGTGASYAPTVTVNTWFQVQIGCPSASTVMASVGGVTVQGVTTSSVPYYESFEGIGLNDRMPNCSWLGSGMFGATRTYTAANTGNRVPRTGNAFAAFTNLAGTHYYYTNGIWMEPNVTYSASIWYTTDLSGAANWSNLALLVGTAQTPSGLSQIAGVNGAVISPGYKSLSNTFTVGTAGYYYVAVRATAASGGAPHLSWDDMSIIIPCTPNLNFVPVQASANSPTICSGTSVLLTATGADTYTWVGVGTGAQISATPQGPNTYTVIGTNTVTSCEGKAMVNVGVNLSPIVYGAVYPPVSCANQPVQLVANGNAASYQWSGTSSQGAIVTVTPSSSGSYSVTGTSTNNCQTTAAVDVSVNPNPDVNVLQPGLTICVGDPAVLTAFGANTYTWVASSGQVISGSPATVYPRAQTTYVVTGSDLNGCKDGAAISVEVLTCTGIQTNGTIGMVNIFPNPANSEITIESSAGVLKAEILDVTGRIVATTDNGGSVVKMNISALSAGVYNVRVSGSGFSGVVRLIKN